MASHTDGLFATLWGTVKGYFHVGGPDGPCLSPSAGSTNIMKTLDSAETDYAAHLAKEIKETSDASLNQLATYSDLNSKICNIIDDFSGATPPSGSNEVGFYICSTTGGSYNENDIIYWNGSTIESYYKTTGNITATATNGKTITHITTQDAITMSTTADLLENALYAWEDVAGTEQWVLKGYAGAGDDMKVIKVSIGTSSSYSSSTAIPANAYISKVQLKVSTAYSSGTSVTVSTPAETIMASTDNVASVVNTYEKSDPQEITTGGVVTVSVGGSPTTGAGVVYVVYGTIFS